MHLDHRLHLTLTRLAEGQTTPDAALEQLKTLLQQAGESERGLSDAAALLMASQYDALSEALEGLIAGIREFEGLSASTDEELERHLKAARNRFAIQLSSALFDTPFVEGQSPATDTASTSIRSLRGKLSELGEVLTRLVGTSIRAAHHEKELELAGTVQRMLVPDDRNIHPALEVASWYRPASQCSGDWWTLDKLGRTDALLCLGDVTGHGVPAALVTAIMKGAVDLARLGMRDGLKPYMLMNMVNHVLLDNVDGDYLMTGIFVRYEVDAGRLRVANAGHRPAWLFRADGSRETLSGDGSPPLGTRRAQRYEEVVVPFRPGDTLVLYTDGIPEAEDAQGRELGERPFREWVDAASAEGPDAVIEAVKKRLLRHVGEATRLNDDVTLVAVRAR